MSRYSVEIDKSNSTALAYCLTEMEKNIPDFEYDWNISINAGGIDYGIYFNIDIDEKELEISNQPRYHDGCDSLWDVFENFENEDNDDY